MPRGKILVTGSRSKIAGPVVEYFASNNYEVKVINRQNCERCKELGVDSYSHDLTAPLDINYSPNVIIHAAALVPYNFDRTISDAEVYSSNVDSLINILSFAVTTGVKRIVLISTIDVYGPQPDLPIRDSAICRPINIYGVAKLSCERIAKTFNLVHGTEIATLRIGAVIGPNMNPRLRIYQMVKSVLAGDAIELRNADDILSLVSEDDVVSAVIAACNLESAPITYNITGAPLPLRGLFDQIRNSSERMGEVTETRDSAERSALVFDLSLAKKELGWSPSKNFCDVVNRFLRHPAKR